jgi:tripartite-type tricarboxylate transporter receptor subunit TctC
MRPALAALVALLLAMPAAAQGLPDRPLRIISGASAGGSNDFVARLMAEVLGAELGQRIVVENRTGVNGVVAAEHVVNSPGDGTTALVCPMSTMTMTPQLIGAQMPVDPGVDLGPIALVGLSSYGLVVRAGAPYRTLGDIIAEAKRRPGQVSYASPGVGSAQHLGGELLQQLTGTQMEHIAFRGAAPAIVEILAGRIDFTMTNLGDAVRQIQSGDLRLLAIADDIPSPVFPGTPSMAATVPELEVVGWFGLCGRRDIPAPALARWVDAMRRVLADPATRERLTQGGLSPLFEDTATFGARIARDRARWKQVIEAVGVKAE